MTQIIDPCSRVEVPDAPDQGQGPNPVSTRSLEIPPAAFPVRQSEPIEQTTVRDSALIEKYLWNDLSDTIDLLRYPQQAVRLTSWQERPEFLDSFRFVAGKNWRFENGNLVFYKKDFKASTPKGVPFDLQTRFVGSDQSGLETCEITLTPDFPRFRGLLQKNNRFSLSESSIIFNAPQNFHAYVFGTGPFEVPLISDTNNWKYDFCFKAPAAFFKSEVDRSSVPLVEGVSITSHYLGLPVNEPSEEAKELTKYSAYRFYENSLDPTVPARVAEDSSQVFFNHEIVNDITAHATSQGAMSSLFSTEQGQSVLNNHVRITLDTSQKVKKEDSFAATLAAGRHTRAFMNFLVNSDVELDAENRFVQILDQSRLGGNVNNKQIVNYEPKSYEQNKPGESDNNFNEHYGFSVYELTTSLSDKQYSRSPIPYDRSNYALSFSQFDGADQRLIDIKNAKKRTFDSILSGDLAHSEIIAYRIEKSNLEGNTLQNFYFFNSYDDDALDFIDTQVFYNREYTYRIYAINAVVGNKYKYVKYYDNSYIDDIYSFKNESPYKFLALNKAVVSFIETPFFEQQIVMIDKPPLFPQVEVVPFFQEVDRIGFRLTPTYGSVIEKPIQIIASDERKIAAMQSNSVNFSETESESERLVHYSSDNPPTEYEVLLIQQPPSSYQDFTTAQRFTKETNYNSGYMELNLEPNKRYYMVFRAADNAGISNPSSVYTMVLNLHTDGIFVEFDEYEMQPSDSDIPMTFERVLKIDPSPEQMSVDFSEQIQQEGFYATAPSVSDLQLGIEENKVWTKDYKFRLISRTTGKAIDLNINYGYDIVQPPVSSNYALNFDDIEIFDNQGPLVEREGEVHGGLSGLPVESENQQSSTTEYDEEGNPVRSTVRANPESVRERLVREERERNMESIRRDDATNTGPTRIYEY